MPGRRDPAGHSLYQTVAGLPKMRCGSSSLEQRHSRQGKVGEVGKTARTKRRGSRRRDAATQAKGPPTAPHEAQGRQPRAPAPDADGRARIAIAVALVVVTFAVYLPGVARDVIVGDSAEFVTVAATLGVAHPPGYPVLTILEHLAAAAQLGILPFRVNLLSAVFSAVTVSLVFVTAARLTGSLLSAAVAACALAANELFWRWSLVAETFPLNDLLAAALVLCLVLWHDRPERGRYLILAGLFGGLGLANQQTIVLLGGAILFMLFDKRDVLRRRPRLIAWSAGAVAAGLVPYAYLPWAASHAPAFNWGNIASFSDVVSHFLRASYGTSELVSEAAYRGGSVIQRLTALAGSFGIVLGLLAAIGAVGAYRDRRWYFWFVAVSFIVAGPIFVAYANINLSLQYSLFVLQRFFLLSLVVTAPLAAFGLEMVVAAFGRSLPRLARPTRPAVSFAALVLIAVMAVSAYPRVDRSHDQIARHYAEDLLGSLDQNAVLLAKGDDVVLPVAYLQEVEHVRPDVTLVMLGLLGADWYVSQLKARHPDLSIPFVRYDKQSANLKTLVAANPGRTIAVVDEPLPDESLSSGYWFFTRGLVQQVLPLAVDRDLPEMVAENERLLAGYRVPAVSEVDQESFERALLSQYALAAYRVGYQYEEQQMREQALGWYQRSLAIDPVLASALAGTKRVSGP